MGASNGGGVGAAGAATVAGSKRPWHAFIVTFLLSERAAWAAQNGLGAMFAALFVVVLDFQFALACLCGVLYSASSLVLSLDRSVGGRLFGGTIFIGTVVGGASLGGGLVSLAWLARGDGNALVDLLPAAYRQTLPSMVTIERLKEALARLTAVPLPPWLQETVDAVIASLSADLGALLPPVSSAYWGLLMALTALAFLPFCAARATPDFGKGVIIAIFMVFASSMLVFGSMVPTLGEHLFWTEVVIGYFKVALAAAAANVLAGVLVCVRSAHDDVRLGCAAIFCGVGIRISRLGTAAAAAGMAAGGRQAAIAAAADDRPSEPAGEGGEPGDQQQLGEQQQQQQAAAVERYLSGLRAYVDFRVKECCQAAQHPGTTKHASLKQSPPGADVGAGGDVDDSSNGGCDAAAAGLMPLPAGAGDADLAVLWAGLALSMKTAHLEPPLPLLCSQPGADMHKYAALEKQLARLQRAAMVLGRGQTASLRALADVAAAAAGSGAAVTGAAPAAAADLPGVLAHVAALAAAACAGAAGALGHMPALGPCAGAALGWLPLPAGAWEDARSALSSQARQLAAGYQRAYELAGMEFALSLGVVEYRALLFCLAAAAEVLDSAQSAEAAAAVALEVPMPASAAAATSTGSEEAKAKDAAGDADTAEKGQVQAQGAGGTPATPPPPAHPSALHRLAANPYVASFGILLLLASPLPTVKLTVDACMRAVRAVPALLRSKEARRKAARDKMVQFAFKYWLAMSGTVIVILALMWRAIPEGPGPLQDAAQQSNFFLVWQPIYASITVAICLQDTVESSLFRGVLRTTMTVLGGTLGYLLMLDGGLANSPYWVVGWVGAGSAVAGLLAPDRTLRYALFLAVFSFNAVILCQYIGCCSVPGDPKVFAGKVVSTVIGSNVALLFGWLILPFYGSARTLRDQAAALRGALDLQRRMHAEVAAAAAGGQAVCTDGWLEAVEADVQAPLARVAADLELNTLDRRQMPLTWHLLPDPLVLRMLQHAMAPLRDRLASAALTLSGDLFAEPGAPLGAKGSLATAPAAVQPGPVFCRVLLQLQPDVECLLGSLEHLVEACTANMEADAAGSALTALRADVAAAVAATQAARLHLHRRYLQEQPAALAAAGGHSAGDFACMAWLHAMLRCVDEMMVAATLLLQEPAQDRDVLGGWLRAWRGQRAQPA